jgi:cohesin loading factor subunit SCC2
MEQHGPAVQVIINGHPQSQQAHTPNMSLSNRSRPLSVDEALQYSSMSGAPVFGIGLSTLRAQPPEQLAQRFKI